MKDTDFEKDSRAHSFWQEWQGAADRAGEPEIFSEAAADSNPDWCVILDFRPACPSKNGLIINLT